MCAQAQAVILRAEVDMGSDLDAGDGDGGSGARGGAGPGPGPVMELHGLMTLFDQEARSCTGSCGLK